MTRARLQVALAGAGMISYHHLVAWQRNPAVEVVAICDPDEGRARKRCVEFGIAQAFTDFRAMLQEARPHVVDIASPMETHAELVLAALSDGVHALCQKPLCPTLAQAEEMLRIAPPGARLMVHENWRFRPWYRIVKAWLASGRIGTLRQVRMAYLGSGLLADERGTYPVLTRQPYMGRISRLMVAEVLTHHLDVLRWLFGPLRVEAAAIARGCNAVRGESCASAMMIDRNGAAIVLEGNMTARGYPARPSDRLEILGDDGRVLLEGPSLTLDAANGERHDLDLAAGYQASFDAALAHFVDGLHSGREFETSPTDNLETLRLVEAVYAKAEQGKARSREAAGLGEVTQ